jgi:hypothetical protein
MQRVRQFFVVPVSESQLAIALSFSALVMSLMLWAILWQTSVIENQRDIIRLLWTASGGGLG